MMEPVGLQLIQAFKSEVVPLDRLILAKDLFQFLNYILVVRYEQEVLDLGPGTRYKIDLSITPEAIF